jgi:prolipoprotein diacylglyceryltransferase
MFLIFLGLASVALGIRFTTTHPETVFNFGPVDVTYYHLLFLAGLLFIIWGVWKWVTD